MAEAVEGVDNLSAIFNALGEKALGRVMRSAANLAMTPVVKQARANAKFKYEADADEGHFVHTGDYVLKGFTKRSIKKHVSVSRDKNRVTVDVGVVPEAYYAVHFVELGLGSHEAQPWLRPAFEANEGTILRIVSDRMNAGIEKEIKRFQARGRQS